MSSNCSGRATNASTLRWDERGVKGGGAKGEGGGGGLVRTNPAWTSAGNKRQRKTGLSCHRKRLLL